jgi:hypothetical protein
MSGPYDPNQPPPWQQPGQQYAPAQPPKRSWPARHKVLTAVLAVVGLFVVLGVIGAVAGGGAATDPGAASPSAPVVTAVPPAPTTALPSATVDPTTDPTTDPAPPADPTIPGDGTFLVGPDIKPGTYRTAGPGSDRKDLGLPCSWQRLKGTSGDLNDVVAAGLPSGPSVVTIKASDKAFTSDGCEKWTLVG